MGIGGKFWGGLIGLIQGGPLGAVIGAVLGHALFDGEEKGHSPSQAAQREAVKLAYFTALFSMLAKLAKADGHIHPREAELVSKFIKMNNFDDEAKAFAKRVFNEAKHQSVTFDDFARDFYRLTGNQPMLHNSILAMLCQVAAADGVLHPAEKRCLESAAQIFRVSPAAFKAIMAQYFGKAATTSAQLDRSYKILNCSENSSVDEIKKSYKRLVKEFHPDTLVSKGLPEELMTQAAERFREVQEAYEQVRKKRGF
jgi:DnaJ like chaperone protein